MILAPGGAQICSKCFPILHRAAEAHFPYRKCQKNKRMSETTMMPFADQVQDWHISISLQVSLAKENFISKPQINEAHKTLHPLYWEALQSHMAKCDDVQFHYGREGRSGSNDPFYPPFYNKHIVMCSLHYRKMKFRDNITCIHVYNFQKSISYVNARRHS